MTPSTTHVDPRIERTQRVVVEATAELLAEDGFERATIDAIAERSGVARSTIYRHWPDRADLFRSAFVVVCSIEDTPDHGSLAADLRHKATHLVDGLRNQAWGRMLPSLIGASAHDADLRRALTSFAGNRRREAAELVQRAIERGEVDRGPDVDAALERFIAPFFFRHTVTGEALDDDLVEAQIERLCAELGAPGAPPP